MKIFGWIIFALMFGFCACAMIAVAGAMLYGFRAKHTPDNWDAYDA